MITIPIVPYNAKIKETKTPTGIKTNSIEKVDTTINAKTQRAVKLLSKRRRDIKRDSIIKSIK